jgi:anti-sigma regulatory factor (Ser/Thr protein kinase)
LRVVLVLEELFTNTVTHGYPDREGPVWVTLASQVAAIEITYVTRGRRSSLTHPRLLPSRRRSKRQAAWDWHSRG